MIYPTECVEAYLKDFPLPAGAEFDPELGMLVWGGDVESDFADKFTTQFFNQLAGFAHNWERCRRLEEAEASTAEPVAFLVERGEGEEKHSHLTWPDDETAGIGGAKVTPLYAAPPSTAEVRAQALEEIFTKLLNEFESYEPGANDYAACCVADTLLLNLFPEYKEVQKKVRTKRIRESQSD